MDVDPAQPHIPGRSFSLADFGGHPDGITPNTIAFQDAIRAIDGNGGGTLNVRPGIYVTGPFALCSGMNLHLDPGATIVFSTAAGEGARGLLTASNVHDIMVSGAGTLFGSGDTWWHNVIESKKTHSPIPQRPYLVLFDTCQRVRIEGVTLTHSPSYNLVPIRCSDVTISGISIYNPADDSPETEGVDPEQVRNHLLREYADDAPNTDGIDPLLCQRVLITHCTIDTGDDDIAISSGRFKTGFSSDILITDCTFLHGHGCSIGSETRGEIRNVTVRRCLFRGTKVGIHLKSARDRGGLVSHIVCSDLTMTHVGEAILITSQYPKIDISIYFRPYLGKFAMDLADGGREEAQQVTPETPHWEDLEFRKITATCIWEAGLIQGLPEMPVDGITLDRVSIEAPTGLHINYARHLTIRDLEVNVHKGASVIAGAGTEAVTH
ncbi:MAG TPA: glycosyl hydrolase family 28 protein [Opitutaceae bacterium]|nr:glycosyl hydrolase family 28 protein [Opitutaceae bacterium]